MKRTPPTKAAIAENVLRQYLRSHRETIHLTSSKVNVRRLRSAHAEIEAEIAKRMIG
jgi:PHD/YefM family antitoxin component YafN of YafNO toxin-antitoxin module